MKGWSGFTTLPLSIMKESMKKILLSILTALALTACGSSQKTVTSCENRVDLPHSYVVIGDENSKIYLKDGTAHVLVKWDLKYRNGKELHGGDNVYLQYDANGNQVPDVINFKCSDGTLTATEESFK